MFSLTAPLRRLTRAALLTVAVCGAAMSASGPASGRHADAWSAPLGAANAWLATLPSGLTPPSVAPTWQVVSMIADDVDADGDLDVVANDGSLDLVVWINDGTGRLSRQREGSPAPGQETLAGPGMSDQPEGSQAAAHVPSSALPTSATSSVLLDASPSPWSGRSDPPLPDRASARSPRGPPLPSLAS